MTDLLNHGYEHHVSRTCLLLDLERTKTATYEEWIYLERTNDARFTLANHCRDQKNSQHDFRPDFSR